ncbi:MAG: hypothetical protein ACKOTA_02640, partial [Solirubrobacterales bacterium]
MSREDPRLDGRLEVLLQLVDPGPHRRVVEVGPDRPHVAPGQYDFDAVEASTSPSPDEQVAGFERVARSAEA